MSKKQNFGLQAFAKVEIKENGKLIGDSGWTKNVITDYGLNEGFIHVLLGSAGSAPATAAALGSGGAPSTNDTTLPSILEDETNSRDALTQSIISTNDAAGVTARWYGTFLSSESQFSTSHAIDNIGLYASTATDAGSLLCGAAYTQSTLDTNQDVEYSYEWQIATTT